ncbi:Arf-GAP domain and FG repeat-containing protein 1 [Orchesella cincta]|uniref:Arf-GAP domain and FG repeat-containing protein 1 n=1 Tax=Orchesella cincta TaxID=48709 RepID=A0A1D2NDV9_ORCCI|nr:Arf-GAP domain and FG repeat-containing protein 1 [Orchesella cincta]
MASFTPEEIEMFKSRGNDYCRKVWLATCTSRDSHIGSEKDPDRLNALKSFMSAKYEQKRYYVDPSKLSDIINSEMNQVRGLIGKTVSDSPSSISNSSGSAMQKSPSLSSASSASSLSLHNQNNPSPILNNSRNSQQMNPHNRLVNSITLPDIKPLSSLIGPVNISSATNQTNGSKSNNLVAGSLAMPNGKTKSTPVPIFINNLSSSSQQNQGKSVAVNGTSAYKDPWEGDNNNFNANFADFDAFNSNGKVGGNGVNDLNNFANFDAFQQPLVPANNSVGVDSHSTKNIPPPSSNGMLEDRYAALKDLDNIFKQGGNGDATGNGLGGSHGLSSSASFPANLSSSTGNSGLSGGGWFSTSPNTGVNSSSTNGSWSVNGASGPNPHNPFFSNASAWQSPSTAASNSLFSTSPGTGCFQTAGAAPNGFANPSGVVNGTANGLFGANNGVFSNQLQPVSSSSSFNKVANPFYATMPTPSVNPNNPFL